MTSDQLDRLCIDTGRFLSVDAVQKADSGHPDMPLGAAPMADLLSTRLLAISSHSRNGPAIGGVCGNPRTLSPTGR